ncbi:MAG: DNA methyltransferase, partial [Micromonosporaceae bacterium]
ARFPVALPEFFIRLMTQPGQLVLDPFAGTGTTGVAAEKLGRQWLLSELDETYASVLPYRLAKVTRERPDPREIADEEAWLP